MIEEFKKRKLEEWRRTCVLMKYERKLSDEQMDAVKANVDSIISDLISEVEEEMKLNMAEQQLLGFHHRNVGYEIESLCEDMGLTKKEFDKLREQGMIEYLTDEEKTDIENFIINS